MAYVLNSTGRSRRRRRHCSCDCSSGSSCEDIVFAESFRDVSCDCKPNCRQPRPPRNVIYRGPCPPDPDCACQPPLPPPPCDPVWYRQAPSDRPGFGYYAQVGDLIVDAGDAIPMNSVVREQCGSFNLEGRSVSICRLGTYLASFALTLPAASVVNTQITMELDGEILQGSTLNVVKAAGAPGSAFVQVVFDVTEPSSQLEVMTSSALALIGETPCDTLASLTLVQIDGAHFDRLNGDDRGCDPHGWCNHCNCHH